MEAASANAEEHEELEELEDEDDKGSTTSRANRACHSSAARASASPKSVDHRFVAKAFSLTKMPRGLSSPVETLADGNRKKTQRTGTRMNTRFKQKRQRRRKDGRLLTIGAEAVAGAAVRAAAGGVGGAGGGILTK